VVMQAEIKKFIVVLMLQSSQEIRKQLSEALALIAKSDFPLHWQTLLPELVLQLENPDINIQVGFMAARFERSRQQSLV
jgi:hypothetical protein